MACGVYLAESSENELADKRLFFVQIGGQGRLLLVQGPGDSLDTWTVMLRTKEETLSPNLMATGFQTLMVCIFLRALVLTGLMRVCSFCR